LTRSNFEAIILIFNFDACNSRQLSQTLEASQALGQVEELETLEEGLRLLQSALDVERENGAVTETLLLSNGVLGVRRQAGVQHLLHHGVRLEHLGHGHSVDHVLSHANLQRFQTAVHQEAVEWRRNDSSSWKFKMVYFSTIRF